MSGLVEFLRARLAEDEAAARAASSSPWKDPDEADELESLLLTREDAYHIYRWEPARVLAEVDAKRRIVEHYIGVSDLADPASHPDQAYVLAKGAVEWTLMALALPYADHANYDEAWRP